VRVYVCVIHMLRSPCLAFLALPFVGAEHPGPDFAGFVRSGAIGTWRGVVHRNSDGAGSRDVEALTARLDEASHDVQAVKRGDEVVGICEAGADGIVLQAERATPGCTFFSHGSWAVAPPLLSGSGPIVVRLCLASRGGGQRHRFDVHVQHQALMGCQVAFQASAPFPWARGALVAFLDGCDGDDPSVKDWIARWAEPDWAATASTADWKAATRTELVGRPRGRAAWSNELTRWRHSSSVAAAAGRGGLPPRDAVWLVKGRCWVAVRRRVGGGLLVEAGSLLEGEAKV